MPRASLREGDCESRSWVLWASLPGILSVAPCVFKWASPVFTCCAAKRAFLNRRAVCYEQLKKAVWGAQWK